MAEQGIPDYPIFDATDLEAAWGADMSRYLSRSEGTRISNLLRKEYDCASRLFFSGGKLIDHGFEVKDGIAAGKVYRALSAILRSFEPPHEAKMGTAALAIHRWCEPVTEQAA